MTKTKNVSPWRWIRWVLLVLGALLALGLAIYVWQSELEPLLVDVEDLQRADLYSRVYTGAVSGGLVIVAALIAFFGVRMNVNEQRAQRLAADTRAADQLEEQQKRADQQRTRETLRDLRSRYSAAADQISNDSTAMQQAGIYGLVALADDWEALGDRAQTQACIDLLCAVARSRTAAKEVQDAIMRTIDERVSARTKQPGQDWSTYTGRRGLPSLSSTVTRARSPWPVGPGFSTRGRCGRAASGREGGTTCCGSPHWRMSGLRPRKRRRAAPPPRTARRRPQRAKKPGTGVTSHRPRAQPRRVRSRRLPQG